MKENLCEIRNCGSKYKESKFRTFFGGIEIKECPVSFISSFSQSILKEYCDLRTLNSLGGFWSIDNKANKKCESFLIIKSELNKIEQEQDEKNRIKK